MVVPANPELSEQVAASGRLHNAAVRIQRRGGDHGVMLNVQVERRQYDQAGQVGIICKRGDRGWVGDESLHPPVERVVVARAAVDGAAVVEGIAATEVTLHQVAEMERAPGQVRHELFLRDPRHRQDVGQPRRLFGCAP